jgi:hypothetical protein
VFGTSRNSVPGLGVQNVPEHGVVTWLKYLSIVHACMHAQNQERAENQTFYPPLAPNQNWMGWGSDLSVQELSERAKKNAETQRLLLSYFIMQTTTPHDASRRRFTFWPSQRHSHLSLFKQTDGAEASSSTRMRTVGARWAAASSTMSLSLTLMRVRQILF